MAHDQSGVPLFEKLNRIAFKEPIALPESPTETSTLAGPAIPSSGKPDTRCSVHFGVHVPPACRRSSPTFRPSQPRSTTLRRLSQRLQPALMSGTIDLKRLSMLPSLHATSVAEEEDEEVLKKRKRRCSSLERDSTGKLQPVYSLAAAVSSDSGSDSDDSGVFTRQAPALVSKARTRATPSKPRTQAAPASTPVPQVPEGRHTSLTSAKASNMRPLHSPRPASPLQRQATPSSRVTTPTAEGRRRSNASPQPSTVRERRTLSIRMHERRGDSHRVPTSASERTTPAPRQRVSVRATAAPFCSASQPQPTPASAIATTPAGRRSLPRVPSSSASKSRSAACREREEPFNCGLTAGKSQCPAREGLVKTPDRPRGAEGTRRMSRKRALTPYPLPSRKVDDEDAAERTAQTTRLNEPSPQQVEERLMDRVAEPWQRLLADYEEKLNKTQHLFAERRAAIRTKHLQDRQQLNSILSEQSQVLVKQLVLSDRFATMSDDDFNLTIKQLSSHLSEQQEAAVSILEDTHWRDWQDFLHHRDTCLTHLQDTLVSLTTPQEQYAPGPARLANPSLL